MALKKGVCHNYTQCTIADTKPPVIQEVDSSEFICAECGKELYEYKEPTDPFPLKLILIIVAALLLIGGGIWAYFGLSQNQPGGEEGSVSLSLNKNELSLYVGENETLNATVHSQPEDATITVFYTSDNENVVQVGNNGDVRAISKGKANITVVAQMETGIADTAIAKIIVQKKSVSLTLDKDAINLNIGESETLKATIYSQPEDKKVSLFFTSDNKNVAHVDNEGTVLAVSKGEANIIVVAQMENGIADTALAKVIVDKLEKTTPQPGHPTSKPNPKDGWYTWNGGYIDGKPHGKGTMKITKTHTIELADITGSKITVYPGETIIAKFDHGQLRGGDIIHKDGSSTKFVNNI